MTQYIKHGILIIGNNKGDKMILNSQTIDVKQSTNFKSTDFRIDARYKNKVLWMLINQYRFKIRTPIQEIVSNARDAQRENGNPDRPIKIQLPTRIEPTFIVRDYGVGMSEERINNIFTSFGASTKNADNSQTGGFGIGAKSPLAYTDSFNIKTYINGQYWFYVVAKTSDDGIAINLLDKGTTTEENGTEVQIPVASGDSRDFIEAACRTTMFWDVQPIFNLNKEDLYNVSGGTIVSNDVTVYTKQSLGNLFDNSILLVIDGIPYEVDNQLLRQVQKLRDLKSKLNYNGQIVIKLNTGDIDLLQTRESLDETERTLSQLRVIAFKAFSDLEQYLESCLTEKTLQGRIKQYQSLFQKFSGMYNHNFETFKISNRDLTLDNSFHVLSYDFNDRYGRNTLTRPQRRSTRQFIADHNKSYLYLWDDLKDAESDNTKARRMRYFLEQNRDITPVLINKAQATNFVYLRTLRMLGAKKLSSLELPPKSVRVKGTKKATKKKSATHITIHRMDSYRSSYKATRASCTLKIDDITAKYVYTGYTESSEIDNTAFNFTLKDQYGLVAVKLAKADLKIAQGHDNFISLEEFKASFKPTESMLNHMVTERINVRYLPRLASNISENSTRLKDKSLTKMAQYVKLLEETDRVPRGFKNLMGDKYTTKIDNRVTIVSRFKSRLESHYPMLHTGTIRQDLINYINGGK